MHQGRPQRGSGQSGTTGAATNQGVRQASRKFRRCAEPIPLPVGAMDPTGPIVRPARESGHQWPATAVHRTVRGPPRRPRMGLHASRARFPPTAARSARAGRPSRGGQVPPGRVVAPRSPGGRSPAANLHPRPQTPGAGADRDWPPQPGASTRLRRGGFRRPPMPPATSAPPSPSHCAQARGGPRSHPVERWTTMRTR